MLTSGQVAQILGFSQATVLRAVRGGLLTPARITPGGHYRFSMESMPVLAGVDTSGALLTTRELATELGLSRSTVVRAVRQGRLSPTNITPGGHLRFSPPAKAS